MKKIMNGVLALAAVVALSASAVVAAPADSGGQANAPAQLESKVRKELATLPYYGVFDNLEYQVNGSTVTLYGQVVQPVTRKDAESRVAHIAGVSRVVNKIEVLPPSSFDDAIRVREYRTLFGWNSPLLRYGGGANPSIHIIVRGGHVTLEGVVSNQSDSQMAYIRANQVPGVFSVTNNLRVENERAR
jgi:hyperosmotically inducible protein